MENKYEESKLPYEEKPTMMDTQEDMLYDMLYEEE